MRRIIFGLCAPALLLLAPACGGGSSHNSNTGSGSTSVAGGNTIASPASNVAALRVDGGPPSLTGGGPVNVNVAFVTVQVCAPGTTNCQTIDHVVVDTGSTGLRIPQSVLNSTLLSAMQNANGSSSPLAECVQFLDNTFFWGSVRMGDVSMGGSSNNSETAHSMPIQVMGDPSVPNIPSDCSSVITLSGQSVAGTEEDSVKALGANGLIGVSALQYDCDIWGGGNACTSAKTLPTGTYYICPGGSCSNSNLAVPLTMQLRNPVSAFATDNNGVIVQMPAVPIGGQGSIASGAGALVFGIGTQSNNMLASSATVLPVDTNINDPQWSGFTTIFNGTSYPNSNELGALESVNSSLFTIGSFIDSGSNAVFFLDQPTSGIATCSGNLNVFYCPNNGTGAFSTVTLSANNVASNGASRPVQFSVSAATTFNGAFTAFSDLAGPNSTGSISSLTQASDGFFDWGLPFFFGRNVYVGIQGVSAPNGVPAGPYWAY